MDRAYTRLDASAARDAITIAERFRIAELLLSIAWEVLILELLCVPAELYADADLRNARVRVPSVTRRGD
jgi:hypothetical protein